VLMHRINNATQVLAGLNALITLGSAEALLASRASDLQQVARTYAESGWLLAALGSALGAETLLERREAQGLEPVLELARELARRTGTQLEFAGQVPRLCPTAGRGWEPAWALGSWLFALSATPAAPVRLLGDEGALRVEDDAPWSTARAALAQHIASRIADVQCGPNRLRLGPSWFR